MYFCQDHVYSLLPYSASQLSNQLKCPCPEEIVIINYSSAPLPLQETCKLGDLVSGSRNMMGTAQIQEGFTFKTRDLQGTVI